MKTNILKLATMALVIGSLALTSCKKDPKPTPEPAQEEFDASRVQFVLLKSDGSQTTDTTSVDFDRSGMPTPGAAELLSSKQYKLYITLMSQGESVNAEINDDGTAHQFFFLPAQGGIFTYAYNDADENNQGIGLVGTASITAPGTTALKIVLRHGLDKSKPEAQAWNSPNYQNAGGEDDLNIKFDIKAM